MNTVGKNVGYLLIRMLCVAILSITTIILNIPVILAILYGFALIYFFAYTMWYAGDKDANAVGNGRMAPMPHKGFLCGGIVTVPMCVIMLATLFFLNPESSLQGTMSLVRLIFALPALNLYNAMIDVSMTAATLAVCGLYIVCAVCAGVGYIIGYKRLHPIKKLLSLFSTKLK